METSNQHERASTLSPEFRKKRKFYLVVPVLVLPFLTMAFWALGGGSVKKTTGSAVGQKGINMALPSAQFKGREATDKLGIYQIAARDSAKDREGQSRGFIQRLGFDAAKTDSLSFQKHFASALPDRTPADVQSEQITAKLAEINRQISKPAPAFPHQQTNSGQEAGKLHELMKAINTPPEKDPEMEQLTALLSKVQAIQNPETNKPKVPDSKVEETAFLAIPAIVDGRQNVMNGGSVRLKLTDSVRIRGELLLKGQLLFGACQVTNQRLMLSIQNIRLGTQIIPVSLTVFGLDGMPGIPAPEAELSGAAETGADNALQSMQIMSMDPGIGAQAAAGGINAAKGLFSKKVHKIKVKLKDEFPVLLRINKN